MVGVTKADPLVQGEKSRCVRIRHNILVSTIDCDRRVSRARLARVDEVEGSIGLRTLDRLDRGVRGCVNGANCHGVR